MNFKKLLIITAFFAVLNLPVSAKESPEEKAKNEEIRASLPLGGNFSPKKEEGIFMAAGHGMNIVVSRDDGKTWTQSFYGRPCGDHGYWSVWNNIAYTNGVFAVASGWGAPGTVIATDDGKTWKHLTSGEMKAGRKSKKPYDTNTTMQFIGVDGAFIMPLVSTPDFGKTWNVTSPYGWKDDKGNKIKPNAGHPSMAYGDGRVIVVGDAGPAIYSDDLGKTWKKLYTKVEPWEERGTKSIVYFKGAFLLAKGSGKTIFRSTDKGLTWAQHELGIKRPAGRSNSLSVVGDEVWATGETSKRSSDGITWTEVEKKGLNGQIAISDKGTLISVSRKRYNILRSEDNGKTWIEVYKFTPKGTGGAQGLGAVKFGYVKKIDN